MEQNTQTTVRSKRLTVEDVKFAIESNKLDPMTVGPTKIKEILKSGSFTTISEYLKAIRTEIHNKKAIESNVEAAPPVPTQIAQQIYDLAYQAAFIQIQKAFASVSIENATLKADLESARKELTEMLEATDSKDEELEATKSQVSELNAQLEAIKAQYQSQLDEQSKASQAQLDVLNTQLTALQSQVSTQKQNQDLEALQAQTREKAINDLYEKTRKELDIERQNASKLQAMFEQLVKSSGKAKKGDQQ